MPSKPTRQRLSPEVFDLPVEKMRAGWYTDAYFNHTRATLLADGRHPRVVVQVFQKNDAWLGGVDEAIAILRLCSDEPDGLTIRALHDGDRLEPWETVLTIEGDYTTFAHLETVYLGALARRTLITTNVVRVLEAANGKPIIFMPARFDHQRVQAGDGYAAYVAGQVTGFEIGVTSDEQASWWGGRGIGTVPHALIAACGGDTVLAAQKFAEWAPPEMSVTVLVDFENDSVRAALELAELCDVAAEEERHRPVDDDADLPLHKWELVQVVRARDPPAEEAVQVQAEHLRDALVSAEGCDLAEHAVAVRLGRPGQVLREPACLAEGVLAGRRVGPVAARVGDERTVAERPHVLVPANPKQLVHLDAALLVQRQ
jgi:hypothetical protein